MAADSPDGPAPTMRTSRTGILTDNNAHMKKHAALVCVLVLVAASPRAQGKRFITEKDLFKFTWIADPQISPDGSTVAFVRVTVNEKDNRYESSLYIVPTDGSSAPRPSTSAGRPEALEGRRLTSGIRDTGPRWSPDGKQIAFARSIDKDGKPQPSQIYLLAMDGGEARPITELARGASNPVWSPDGKAIAFNSSTGQAGRGGPEGKDAHKSDGQVITRAVYRANGNPTWGDTDHHADVVTTT